MPESNIVDDVRELRSQVAEVLRILRGDEYSDGLREQVRELYQAVGLIEQQLVEQAQRDRARMPFGILAGLGSIPVAALYQMMNMYEWRVALSIDRITGIWLNAGLILLLIALVTFCIRAVIRFN